MTRAPSISEFKQTHWPRLRDILPAEKVVIFGSQLRGGEDEESDLDLIIVSSRFEGLTPMERYEAVRQILKPDYSTDIFYYTPQDFQNAVAERGMIAEAVRDGVSLEAKREEEIEAFNLFARQWEEMTGQHLEILDRPEPPDFLCQQEPSGRKVAVEVTSIFLDISTPEEKKRIAWERFLAHQLRPHLRGRVPGTFALRLRWEDCPASWRPEKILSEFEEVIVSLAPSIKEGQREHASRPCHFELLKVSDLGSKVWLGGLGRVYGLSEEAFAGLLKPIIGNKNARLRGAGEKPDASVLLIVDHAHTSLAEEELRGSGKLICPLAYSNLDYVFLVRLHTEEVIQFLPLR